jgi:hypothetical protein
MSESITRWSIGRRLTADGGSGRILDPRHIVAPECIMQEVEQQNARYAYPRLDALEATARSKGALKVAVAYPCSVESLGAAVAAREEGMIDPILVGPARIELHAAALDVSLDGIQLVDVEDDPIDSSKTAVALVSAGETVVTPCLRNKSYVTHERCS